MKIEIYKILSAWTDKCIKCGRGQLIIRVAETCRSKNYIKFIAVCSKCAKTSEEAEKIIVDYIESGKAGKSYDLPSGVNAILYPCIGTACYKPVTEPSHVREAIKGIIKR